MARKTSCLSTLSNERQEELRGLAIKLTVHPAIRGDVYITDTDKHNEYLERKAKGEEDIYDEGISYRVNLDCLSALIELLYDEKSEAKVVEDSFKTRDKSLAKSEALEKAGVLKQNLEVGDVVRFTMGNVKTQHEYEMSVIKVTDKCFHVEFTEDKPCITTPDKPTGVRHIKFTALIANLTKTTESDVEKAKAA